jgi:hypothetical protein
MPDYRDDTAIVADMIALDDVTQAATTSVYAVHHSSASANVPLVIYSGAGDFTPTVNWDDMGMKEALEAEDLDRLDEIVEHAGPAWCSGEVWNYVARHGTPKTFDHLVEKHPDKRAPGWFFDAAANVKNWALARHICSDNAVPGSALRGLARKGDLDGLKEAEAYWDFPDDLLNHLVGSATEHGQAEVVREYASRPWSPSGVLLERKPMAPGDLTYHLGVALKRGHLDTVRVLLDLGAHVLGRHFEAPIRQSRNDILDLLLEYSKVEGSEALKAAVDQKSLEVFDKLVEAGAQADKALLLHAVKGGATPFIPRIVRAGAKLDDDMVITAINTGTGCVKNLVEDGLLPGPKAVYVEAAVKRRDPSALEALLKYGCPLGNSVGTADSLCMEVLRDHLPTVWDHLDDSA